MAFELNNHVISKYCLKILLESDTDQQRTTRYMLQSYIALRLMAVEVDGRVFVSEFLRYRLYKFMRDDLAMGSYSLKNSSDPDESHCMAKQSIYSAFDRLSQLGLVYEMDDPQLGRICTLPMEFLGFKPHEGDSSDALKGFVRIPQFLISPDFINLTLRDQKLCLYILQKLYNENDTKNLNFLSRSERRTTPEGKTELERIMRICHINRFAHVKTILEKLRAFFKIDELISTTRKTFSFSILDKFRLPGRRSDKPTTDQYNPTIYTLLHKMLQNVNAKFPEKSIISMAKAISMFDFSTQKAAIDQLIRKIRSGDKQRLNNPASYLRGIALNLQTT